MASMGTSSPLLKPHAELEIPFTLGLALQVALVVPGGEHGVGVGIEHGLVDAVDYPGQLVGAGVQYALQPLGVIRRHNFPGIAGADGVYPVREHAAGLHEIGAAVELHELRREVLVVHAQHVPDKVEAVLALIFDIVDGQKIF
jgi:hypothetical protein